MMADFRKYYAYQASNLTHLLRKTKSIFKRLWSSSKDPRKISLPLFVRSFSWSLQGSHKLCLPCLCTRWIREESSTPICCPHRLYTLPASTGSYGAKLGVPRKGAEFRLPPVATQVIRAGTPPRRHHPPQLDASYVGCEFFKQGCQTQEMTGERTLSAAREYKASWSVNSLPTYKKQSVMIQLQGCLNDMSTCSLVTLMDVIVMMAFFFQQWLVCPL